MDASDRTCLQCHNFVDWKAISVNQSGQSQFDHSKTRYPLTGLHAQVSAPSATRNGAGRQAAIYRVFPSASARIATRIPHHGSFPQGCQSCHNTAAGRRFRCRPSTSALTIPRRSFRWKASMPASIVPSATPTATSRSLWCLQKCMDCHKPDPHNGQFAKRPDGGECASCHTVTGMEAVDVYREGARDQRLSAAGRACPTGVRCSAIIPKGKDTQFKIKFEQCTDCHSDQHAGQFAAAPYFNACDRCHNLEGYKPSTFSLAKHKQTHFVLTGGHIAVPCADCHKESAEFQPTPIGDLPLEESGLHQLPRGPAQGPVQRAHAAGASGRLSCEDARLATPPSHGRNFPALTIPRQSSRCSVLTAPRLASIATNRPTLKPS